MKKIDHIETIRLHNVLPAAFADIADSTPVRESELWLNDFTFNRGLNYLIASDSGTGKSSMCSFIYGNRTDFKGEIFFNGINSRNLSVTELSMLRRRSLALLPQEMRLFGELTAIENINIKNRLTGFKSDKEIDLMLDRLNMLQFKNRRVDTLSIGQQQRVAIVRTLCQPFDFILLDEPVSHLDNDNNRVAACLIVEAATSQGAAIIATSVGNDILIDNFSHVKL